MPRIERTGLPDALRKHLLLRLKERQITEEGLYLKLWRDSEPLAPGVPRHKDFGSFEICGEGRYPRTFLLREQPATRECLP